MKSTLMIPCALTLLAIAPLAVAQSQKSRTTEPRAVTQQPAPSDKDTQTTGRIKGRVMADGHPVAEASILVFPVNVSGNMEGAVSSLLRPVNSDADGRFELTGLRPTAYTISAGYPGYVQSDQDSKPFYRPGDNITLTLMKGSVITGRVTNFSGDPVVGAVMRAVRVRDLNNKPARAQMGMFSQMAAAMSELFGPYKSDDRGVYRIYGLAPGVYQVAAGGRGAQGFSLGGANAYDGDAPTYYPSSTLATAADVRVGAGEEASNIDIRYRENPGYSISGAISVSSGRMPQATSVLLSRANNGVIEASTAVLSFRNDSRFSFDALLDGDYVITAMGGSDNIASGSEGFNASVSPPRRVTVKGADVTGVDLVLAPLASIGGRAVLEPLQDAKQKAQCKDVPSAPLEGTVLTTRSPRKQTLVDPLTSLLDFKIATPDEKGEFLMSLIRPGTQRLDVQLPGELLYLKSVSLTQTDPNAKPIDVAKTGITVKSGDRLKGLVVTLSEGAAGLRGRVVTTAESKDPVKLHAHLIPAEPEAADDVLRYFEAEVAGDGAFSLTNIPPGKYWLVTRELSEADDAGRDHVPAAWDAGTRVVLRFEGEASKKVIELSRCQRLTDFVLSYTPLIKPTTQVPKKPQ